MFLIAMVQGYLKPCSKQLKFSVTLYPPLPYVVVSTPAYYAADRGSNPARTRRDY